MFHSKILDEILQQANNKEKVDSIMKFSKNIYDLHQFNIFSLYPREVKKLKDSLDRRYSSNQIKILKYSWNEGQRRLFVWFIICFLYIRKVKPQAITDQDWKVLSPLFHYKRPIFLDFQLRNIFKTSKGKSNWHPKQDEILRLSVQQIAEQIKEQKIFNSWNDVSKNMFFKTNRKVFKSPKACRQRWYNHLDKSKRKDDFQIQQDYTLILNILKGERSWSKLVKVFNNSRTEHRIKNRYFSLLKKFSKQINHEYKLKQQQVPKNLNEKELLNQIKMRLEKSIEMKRIQQIKEREINVNVDQPKIKIQFQSQIQVKIEEFNFQDFQERNEPQSSQKIQKEINFVLKEQSQHQKQNQFKESNVFQKFEQQNGKNFSSQVNQFENQKTFAIYPENYFNSLQIYYPLQIESLAFNQILYSTVPIYKFMN